MKSYANEMHQRLHRLRESAGLTYNEIAEQLGISRSTLHLIRRGSYTPTERVLERLKTLEQFGGRLPAPATGSAVNLLALLLNPVGASSQFTLSREQLDAGTAEVPLTYAGTPPADYPTTLTLRRLETVAGLTAFIQAVVNQAYDRFIIACLPENPTNRHVLGRITPKSLLDLLAAALQLTFGAAWKQQAHEFSVLANAPTTAGPQEVTINTGIVIKKPE